MWLDSLGCESNSAPQLAQLNFSLVFFAAAVSLQYDFMNQYRPKFVAKHNLFKFKFENMVLHGFKIPKNPR
jgi:hypothetical protein